MNPNPFATKPLKPLAPVVFLNHERADGYPESWNLTADCLGRPAGSTLARSTLEAGGYRLPPTPPKPNERAEAWRTTRRSMFSRTLA